MAITKEHLVLIPQPKNSWPSARTGDALKNGPVKAAIAATPTVSVWLKVWIIREGVRIWEAIF